MGYSTEFQKQQLVCNIFSLRNQKTILLNFAPFSFFLYDFITDKAGNLEVAEVNLIMEIIFLTLSVSLCRLGFLSFSFSFTFSLYHTQSLSLSLSLSFLNSFVDAALQLLLCGVMASFITLINADF